MTRDERLGTQPDPYQQNDDPVAGASEHGTSSAPMPPPRRPRAEFMSGPGGVVLGKLAPDFIRVTVAGIDDDTIAEALREVDLNDCLACAESVARLTRTNLYSESVDLFLKSHVNPESLWGTDAELKPGTFEGCLFEYTFSRSVPSVLLEGMITCFWAPLNALAVAQERLPDGYPPIVSSLQDIADLFNAPWFLENARIMARTANGVWQTFSAAPSRDAVPNFFDVTYRLDDNGRTVFGLSDATRAHLSDTVRKRNDAADAWLRQGDTSHDTFEEGSTSKCPVAHSGYRLDSEEAMQAGRALMRDFEPGVIRLDEPPVVTAVRAVGELFARAAAIQRQLLRDAGAENDTL